MGRKAEQFFDVIGNRLLKRQNRFYSLCGDLIFEDRRGGDGFVVCDRSV